MDVIAIGLFDFFSSKNDNVIVYEVAIWRPRNEMY